MRILFYATNGLGLGHVTRLLSISRAVRALDPSHERLFLSRCEAGPFPDLEAPFTLRIPTTSRAKSSGLSPKSYYQVTHPLLWQTVSSFDPHLLVADTFPEGPEGELAPVMRWPIRKAFVYRESKTGGFDGEDTRRKLSPYQMILIAHEQGAVPLPEYLKRDPRVHFTGPIIDESGSQSREELRRRLGFSDTRTALVTLGGGGDPEIRTVLPVIVRRLRERGIEVYVATGPLSPGLPDGITAREWFPAWPVAPWLGAFDLAVGSGGYNTVNELERSGIPALLIPFDRDLDDQAKRTRDAEKAGWAVDAKNRERASLENGIDRLLESPPQPKMKRAKGATGHSGARVAANLLLSMLGGSRSQENPESFPSKEAGHAVVR